MRSCLSEQQGLLGASGLSCTWIAPGEGTWLTRMGVGEGMEAAGVVTPSTAGLGTVPKTRLCTPIRGLQQRLCQGLGLGFQVSGSGLLQEY